MQWAARKSSATAPSTQSSTIESSIVHVVDYRPLRPLTVVRDWPAGLHRWCCHAKSEWKMQVTSRPFTQAGCITCWFPSHSVGCRVELCFACTLQWQLQELPPQSMIRMHLQLWWLFLLEKTAKKAISGGGTGSSMSWWCTVSHADASWSSLNIWSIATNSTGPLKKRGTATDSQLAETGLENMGIRHVHCSIVSLLGTAAALVLVYKLTATVCCTLLVCFEGIYN